MMAAVQNLSETLEDVQKSFDRTLMFSYQMEELISFSLSLFLSNTHTPTRILRNVFVSVFDVCPLSVHLSIYGWLRIDPPLSN